MRTVWCRLFGCGSIFGQFFGWPHRLCWWAADRRAIKEDANNELFTWDPSPLIPLDEVDYRVDDDERVVYSRYEWKR